MSAVPTTKLDEASANKAPGDEVDGGTSLKLITPIWGCSSAGRAPALQAGGHGFDSHHLHQRQVAAAELDKLNANITPKGEVGIREVEGGEMVRENEIHRKLNGLIAQVVRARA